MEYGKIGRNGNLAHAQWHVVTELSIRQDSGHAYIPNMAETRAVVLV